MKLVNANTSLGKRLVATGQNWDGTFLNQVYDKWSTAKQRAWDKCYDEYCNTEVGPHSTQGGTLFYYYIKHILHLSITNIIVKQVHCLRL